MSSPTVNTTNNGMMEALLLQQRGPPPIPFKSDCSNKDVIARDQYVLVHLSIDTRSKEAWKNGENVGDTPTFLGRNSPLFSALTFIPL